MKFITVFLLIVFAHSQVIPTTTGTCQVYSADGVRCLICISSLQLDTQGNCKLYPLISNCNIYNATSPTNQCASCASGYLLSNGGCFQLVANCLSTTNVNYCSQCAPGYVLVSYSNCFSTQIASCSLGSLPRTVNGTSYCQVFTIYNCLTLSAAGNSCANCSSGNYIII